MYLKILFTFTIQELQDILTHLQAIVDIINGRATNLTKGQRSKQHAVKNRKKFIHDAGEFSEQYSFLIPSNDSLENNQKRLTLIHQIDQIMLHLGPVTEMLIDTLIAAGIDSYKYSRGVYKTAILKDEQGVDGMGTVVEVLGKTFEGQGKTNNDSTNNS